MSHDDLDTPTQANTISIVPRNATMEIRVALGEYHGHRYVDVRNYVDPPSTGRAALGRVPTRKGIAIPLAALDDVIRGLQKARAEIAEQAPANANQPKKTGTR
jgi:hypothetical protein